MLGKRKTDSPNHGEILVIYHGRFRKKINKWIETVCVYKYLSLGINSHILLIMMKGCSITSETYGIMEVILRMTRGAELTHTSEYTKSAQKLP